MKKQLTKTEKVLNHLKKYGKISNAEAKSRYGVKRLRDVVYSLRKQGITIEAVPVPTKKGVVGRKQHKYLFK